MEEETKHEALLLNEKYVKLENDDSWREIRDSNVKEELLDHDYCVPYPMELVETDHFLKPKEEEESDQYEYQLLEPKSEALFEYPEYLKLEPKLEEPDDSEYTRSMQNSVKLEDIDYCSEDLLESKLEEPDDFEYSEYLKLESIESEHDIGPIRKQKSYSIWKPQNRKCAICHKLVRPDQFTRTASKYRQMILMLGLLIAQKKSVEEAQLLITGKRIFICIAHVKEAIDEIFNAMNTRNVNELNQCSNEEFQKIMDINKNICPDISFPQFRRALICFVVKFTESIRSLTTLEETDNFSNSLEPKMEELDSFEYPEYPELESIKTENDIDPIRKQSNSSIQNQLYHKCSVCREFVYLYELSFITTKERKLILMLGLILKGTKTIEEAHFYISGWIYTCTVHLKDAVSEILKALNIKSMKEFHPYGNKNMQISIEKLLDILKMMSPGFLFSQFRKALIVTARMFLCKSSTIKPSIAIQKRCCMVCHQLESDEGFTDVTSKENKLILLVGLTVGRKKTMKEARLLMNNPLLFCCKSHLSECGYKILEVLNIRRIDELHSYPVDKLMEVMNIVWKLCSECSVTQFKIHLTIFLRMGPTTIDN